MIYLHLLSPELQLRPPSLLPPLPPLSLLALAFPAPPATQTQDKLQRTLVCVLEYCLYGYKRNQIGRLRQAKQSRELLSRELPDGGVGWRQGLSAASLHWQVCGPEHLISQHRLGPLWVTMYY